ncbi:MAG: nucleotidyltransferase family protein [Nitrospirae bacterium]|nr:nucleotidyltransferase family protein [Nitrospirota bacterium]
MEAIILAGGLGTRLQSVVKDVPKPMADINGRPFMSFLMDYLSRYGVKKVVLSVGYKHETIKNYFGSGYKEMDVEYVTEDQPLGTGGALRETLRRVQGSEAIVLNGDSFFNVNLNNLIDFHHSQDSMLTLAVKPMNNIDRYGTIILQNERVTGFSEKSSGNSGYINGGVYVMKKESMNHYAGEGAFSFETDFLQRNINSLAVSAFISDGYFIDIGVPEDYKRAQKELQQVLKEVV